MCSPTDSNTSTTQDIFLLMQRITDRPRRKVRFAPDVATVNSSPLAFEELADLWYQQTDLVAFKAQAKSLLKAESIDENESTRGLEYCTIERQRHKALTIRCTLSAHRRGMSADHTAQVARKCTVWSEEVAFVQACHDYCTVYQPAMTPFIPKVDSVPPEFPFSIKKRAVSPEQTPDSERRVRRCIRA